MNPIRNCIGCGQQDDHPRHVTYVGDWHTDCHARSANGCELCQAVVDSHDGLTGDELRTHLERNDPARPVAERQTQQFLADLDQTAEV